MARSVPLPSDIADPIALADWLELLALTATDTNASYGDLQRVLNSLSVENLDGVLNGTMSELNRRVDAARDSYPFTFSGTLLQTRGDWRDYTSYVFCLLLSYCDDKKKRIPGVRHELMFEQLSCIAAQKYIGGDVLRFGFPRRELPRGFRDALTVICGKVKEWTPSTEKTLGRKDGGLDLIAWRHFPDQQIGKLILFGHCASGADWGEKITELQPDDFCSQWLGGYKSPIVKTFFIPHRLSPDVFSDRAVSAKLFFDRCRIAFWAPSHEFRNVTHEDSVRWCEGVLERIAS
ncbi:MAG: hypothetical protein MUC88_25325 [Planctomycetes bacterium]|jgi:hypothetical protein|nr:hypothetical protein [Planctomycetota bacterium]